MKVLWITNIPVNVDNATTGGWMSGLYGEIQEKVEIVIAYPHKKTIGNNTTFYYNQECYWYNPELEESIGRIIDVINPDLVHIWGTEFYQTYATLVALNKRHQGNRAVISLQGIMTVYSEKYYSDVPYIYTLGISVKDLIKKTAMWYQKLLFKKRGRYERKALAMCHYVIGRTDFDKKYALEVNHAIRYFYAGEILRKAFYSGDEWKIEKAEKNRIYISQASYPIKGFHIFLRALVDVVNDFPNVEVYVGGNNVYAKKHPAWRTNSYEQYVIKYMKKNKLIDKVTFLGMVDEREVKNQLLKCRVFVSPSSIENSPNSIGEAMILGTPIIASNVGGVPSLLDNGKNGLLYDFEDSFQLARIIKGCLSDDCLCNSISNQEKKAAKSIYGSQEIAESYLSIYKEITRNL